MKRPEWKTPEEFGVFKILPDGSCEYKECVRFWALIILRNTFEIHLCSIDEYGLVAHDLENDTDYDLGRSVNDISYCMEYEHE